MGQKETDLSWSIVSTVGGRINHIYAEEPYQRYFCSLERAASFVEKFLLIKEAEKELKNFNCVYFLEFEVDNAVFWFQRRNKDSVDGIDDINSS